MSDRAARHASAAALQPEAGTLPPGVDEALALCLDTAAAFARGAPCGAALDALETLLPALSPSDIDALIAHPDYAAVRATVLRACAETWFERECDIARRALDAPASDTLSALFGDHIPRDAYADELAVLHSIQPRSILIIGSGACPMSALVIQAEFPDAAVVGLDRSAEACELAARVLAACGQGHIRVLEGDAAGPVAIEAFDCILLALTVGIDEAEKDRIIRALRRAADPQAVLVARVAAGWGRVLYPGTGIPVILSRGDLHRDLSALQRSVAVAVRMAELPD